MSGVREETVGRTAITMAGAHPLDPDAAELELERARARAGEPLRRVVLAVDPGRAVAGDVLALVARDRDAGIEVRVVDAANALPPLDVPLDAEALWTAEVMDELVLPEPLSAIAPVARAVAPSVCAGCAAYHGLLPTLRMLGVVASPQRQGAFYREQFVAAAARGHTRVLVAGAADCAMLTHVLAGYRAGGVEPRVTLLDRCPTPLLLSQLHAAQQGVAIDVLQADAAAPGLAEPVDLIVTDSLLTLLEPEHRLATLRAWREALAPGGRIVTSMRLLPERPAAAPSRPAAERTEAFVQWALAELDRRAGLLELDRDTFERDLRRYAVSVPVTPVRTSDEVAALVRDADLELEALDAVSHAGRSPVGRPRARIAPRRHPRPGRRAPSVSSARPPVPPGPYLVVGLGRAGRAAVGALTAHAGAAQVRACDGVDPLLAREAIAAMRADGIEVATESDGIELLERPPAVRCVVKSPGVPPSAPVLRRARELGVPVMDELELGWRRLAAPVTGVTGTNGKGTVCHLLSEILRAAGLDAPLAGNTIFAPPLSALGGHPDHVVCEVSSYQLEGAPEFLPEAAVFTNLRHDHLRRHGDMERYGACKRRLFVRGDRAVPLAVVDADEPLGAGARRRRGAARRARGPPRARPGRRLPPAPLRVDARAGVVRRRGPRRHPPPAHAPAGRAQRPQRARAPTRPPASSASPPTSPRPRSRRPTASPAASSRSPRASRSTSSSTSPTRPMRCGRSWARPGAWCADVPGRGCTRSSATPATGRPSCGVPTPSSPHAWPTG